VYVIVKIHSVPHNKLSMQHTDQLVMLFTIGMTENAVNKQCGRSPSFLVLHKVVCIFTAGFLRINRSYCFCWSLKRLNEVSVCIPHSACETLNINAMPQKTNDSSWDMHDDVECSPSHYLKFQSILDISTFNFIVFWTTWTVLTSQKSRAIKNYI